MKKKRFIYSLGVAVISSLVCVGVVYAASYDITSRLGGKSGDSFDIKGALLVDSIRVGRAGTGGVTYFNGTIINSTTGTGGTNNPVTFGDNVRIDGTLYRGATAGPTDTLPFKINDNMEVAGSLTVGSLSGTGIVTTGHILDGTIATADIADSAVTTAKIADGTIATADLADSSITSAKIADGTITTADLASGTVTQGVEGTSASVSSIAQSEVGFKTLTSLSITTGADSLFCSWSGYGDTPNEPYHMIWVQMILDGVLVQRTVRIARTSAGDVSTASLATQAILPVTAGTHTVAVQWSTETNTSANMYWNTLDCIELER